MVHITWRYSRMSMNGNIGGGGALGAIMERMFPEHVRMAARFHKLPEDMCDAVFQNFEAHSVPLRPRQGAAPHAEQGS